MSDPELPEAAQVAQLRQLAQLQADGYEQKLAAALIELSRRLAEQERYDEAMVAADEAVDIFDDLVERFRGSYLDGLGLATFNLGLRLRDLGQVDDAHILYREAIELRRRAHRNDPYARARFLGPTLRHYSAQLYRDERYEESLAAAQEAIGLFRFVRDETPDAFTRLLAGALDRVALALLKLDRAAEAVDAARRAVNLARRLGEDEASNPLLRAASAILSSALEQAGRSDTARI